MNYHYKAGDKKEELLKQLKEVESGMQQDNQSLERLRLEAEVIVP